MISEANYSFTAVKKTKECVICIPTEKLLKKVIGCGNTTGSEIDKFASFHLTPLPASMVKPPLIKECYACLECKVVDPGFVKKYNLFVLEVQKAWIQSTAKRRPTTLHHLGEGLFMMAGKTVKTSSRKK